MYSSMMDIIPTLVILYYSSLEVLKIILAFMRIDVIHNYSTQQMQLQGIYVSNFPLFFRLPGSLQLRSQNLHIPMPYIKTIHKKYHPQIPSAELRGSIKLRRSDNQKRVKLMLCSTELFKAHKPR